MELLRVTLSQKESELQQCQSQLDQANQKCAKALESAEESEKLYKKATSENEFLQKQLAARPTVQEHEKVTARLKTVESIQFASLNDDPSSLSIEQLLNMKVKKYETEVTTLKNDHAALLATLTAIQSKYQQMEQQTQDQKKLIQQLEEHLALHGNSDQNQLPKLLNKTQDDKSTDNSDVMLKVVSEQRNRFRQRLNEVEEEKQQLDNQLKQYELDIKQLKKDNVAMYERIRYLESYQTSAVAPTLPNSAKQRV